MTSQGCVSVIGLLFKLVSLVSVLLAVELSSLVYVGGGLGALSVAWGESVPVSLGSQAGLLMP